MFLVGLTGGVASGKTTVGKLFAALGVPVLDADLMARRIVEPGRKAYEAIRREFGDDFFDPDSGQVDRAKLRQLIFENEEQRAKLNKITHPEIYRELCWEVAKCALEGHQYVVLDLPLLFEAGVMVAYMHKIIVVTCEEDLQLQRLMEQRRLTERESKLMIGAQMSLEEKAARAQYVIENSGTLEDTRKQVIKIFDELAQSRFQWKIRLVVGVALSGAFSLLFFAGKKLTQALRGGTTSGSGPWRYLK